MDYVRYYETLADYQADIENIPTDGSVTVYVKQANQMAINEPYKFVSDAFDVTKATFGCILYADDVNGFSFEQTADNTPIAICIATPASNDMGYYQFSALGGMAVDSNPYGRLKMVKIAEGGMDDMHYNWFALNGGNYAPTSEFSAFRNKTGKDIYEDLYKCGAVQKWTHNFGDRTEEMYTYDRGGWYQNHKYDFMEPPFLMNQSNDNYAPYSTDLLVEWANDAVPYAQYYANSWPLDTSTMAMYRIHSTALGPVLYKTPGTEYGDWSIGNYNMIDFVDLTNEQERAEAFQNFNMVATLAPQHPILGLRNITDNMELGIDPRSHQEYTFKQAMDSFPEYKNEFYQILVHNAFGYIGGLAGAYSPFDTYDYANKVAIHMEHEYDHPVLVPSLYFDSFSRLIKPDYTYNQERMW